MIQRIPLCGRIAESRQGRLKIRFQPWVTDVKRPEPRRGERKYETPDHGPAVPDGTHPVFAPKPTDESVGYFLSPYRAGAHSESRSRYSIAPYVRDAQVRLVA